MSLGVKDQSRKHGEILSQKNRNEGRKEEKNEEGGKKEEKEKREELVK